MGVADKIGMQHGQLAPEFKDLKGVDGKKHALSDYVSKKVLVIIFSCNHCPYVQAYEDRIIDLQKEFKDKEVQFIAINSNDDQHYPDDSFENMVKRAKEKNFNFDYLRDESQEVAKAYKASHTPHIYLFDEKRYLAYTGKVDDNWQNPSQVKDQYLKQAIVSLLHGKEPSPYETFAIGCSIKWKNT
ncbi:MAG: thioredoxin family protein [Elusimicrobiota bacterium]